MMRRVSIYRELLIIGVLIIVNGFTSSVVGQSDNNQQQCEVVTTDVVVVGAGIAGILATKELNDLAPELDVILVEATDRIGGRVKKGFLGKNNMTVEIGANWLHNDGTPLLYVTSKRHLLDELDYYQRHRTSHLFFFLYIVPFNTDKCHFSILTFG